MPAFGVEGTRRLSGVMDRPLFGTIIKPSVGLTPDQTADVVGTLCEAGLDFVKDVVFANQFAAFPARSASQAVMRVINEHAQRTGKKLMYAFNITGDLDDMRRGHDVVLAHGGTAITVNMLSDGLLGVIEISPPCSTADSRS